MAKKNFMFLVLTVVGGLLFAMGMCMCLLPEWNAFKPGVAVTVLGTGMAMIMAFEGLMIPGMIVGVVGMVLLLGVIPVFKGLK